LLLHLLRLSQAIDILKTTELYIPHLKEDRAICSDPVATDLVGALLAVRILVFFVSNEKNNKLAININHEFMKI